MFKSKKYYLFGKVLITKKRKKQRRFQEVWFHQGEVFTDPENTATFILHNRSQVGCRGFNSVLRCTEINYSIPFALIYRRRNSQFCRPKTQKREREKKRKIIKMDLERIKTITFFSVKKLKLKIELLVSFKLLWSTYYSPPFLFPLSCKFLDNGIPFAFRGYKFCRPLIVERASLIQAMLLRTLEF